MCQDEEEREGGERGGVEWEGKRRRMGVWDV